MTADKRRVQVVLDTGDVEGSRGSGGAGGTGVACSGPGGGGGGGGGQGNAFNFDDFQQQFYSNDQEQQQHQQQQGRAAGGLDDDGTTFNTGYQARKTSIVQGVTSEDLVQEHRKSLACVSMRDAGRAVDQTELGGITLSKRHMMARVEYEVNLDDNAYTTLNTYSFGDTSAESQLEQQQQQQ